VDRKSRLNTSPRVFEQLRLPRGFDRGNRPHQHAVPPGARAVLIRPRDASATRGVPGIHGVKAGPVRTEQRSIAVSNHIGDKPPGDPSRSAGSAAAGPGLNPQISNFRERTAIRQGLPVGAGQSAPVVAAGVGGASTQHARTRPGGRGCRWAGSRSDFGQRRPGKASAHCSGQRLSSIGWRPRLTQTALIPASRREAACAGLRA